MNLSEQKLFEIADQQLGLFTASQAENAGFERYNHHYHLRTGNWERLYRAIYRLPLYPEHPDSEYTLWSLWSRDRQGEPKGTYSHESALRIHELSDINPTQHHLTVPKKFRRNSKTPEAIMLYKEDITASDRVERQGFWVTTPLKTLKDCAKSQRVSPEFMIQAISQALERLLITQKEFESEPDLVHFRSEISYFQTEISKRG